MTSLQEVPLKIVIVGDGACGKSALLLSYTRKKFDFQYIPTVVDNYDVLMSLGDDKNLKLTIVDTAGQEEFANIRKLSFYGADVIMICYNCESISSLDNVKSLWVPEIKAASKDIPFVLVGNKVDMVIPGDPEAVSKQQAQKVAKQLGAYVSLQCSAKIYAESGGSAGKVDQVFKAAIKCGLIKKKVIDAPPPPCCTLF